MKTTCDIIADLLPLYCDGVCSEASVNMVEEHLAECPDCQALLEKMKNNVIDRRLRAESEQVVSHHAKAVKRHSAIVGITVAGILAIPILVTFIVNLATGRTLDWFFIVLTSLLVFASITVVPLVMEENKGLWTLSTFTGSLLLLLLTVAIFTRGDWFIVTAVPILFGLFVFFGPFVLYKTVKTGPLSRHKGLLAMGINTILLYATIITSGIYIQATGDFWRNGFLIPLVSIVYPWAMFFVIRYLKVRALLKVALCFLLTALVNLYLNPVVNFIVVGQWRNYWAEANFLNWQGGSQALNANILVLVFAVPALIGAILLVVSLLKRKH